MCARRARLASTGGPSDRRRVTAPAPLSISDATTSAQGFLRREWRLTLPVALALMAIPAVCVELLAPDATPVPAGDVQAAYASLAAAAQMRLLIAIPALLCVMLGGLAISSLALVPGISVGEALRVGARRLPKLLGAALLAGGMAVVAGAVAALVLFAITGVPSQSAPAQTSTGITVMILAMMAVMARFCLITPIVADTGAGPIAAVRRSWALSKGNFWRLLALLSIMLMAMLVVTFAIQSAIGVVILLLGRATGFTGLADGLVAIVGACISAGVNMLLWILLTAVYRQLASRGI